MRNAENGCFVTPSDEPGGCDAGRRCTLGNDGRKNMSLISPTGRWSAQSVSLRCLRRLFDLRSVRAVLPDAVAVHVERVVLDFKLVDLGDHLLDALQARIAEFE